MGEWPVCSPATTSFLTQSCKSTEGTAQRRWLVVTRPSILFRTRPPRWDARCNFSLGVAYSEHCGNIFHTSAGAGRRQKPRAGQRQLPSQARTISSDAWKLFWITLKGKLPYPDGKFLKTEEKAPPEYLAAFALWSHLPYRSDKPFA